eukprot:CAMPEP_0171720382 /NCGR_PEP_ID=MMETSP0991-20121206/21742_1 /TAXON_ID=483369 /ORGANISM="non described non described, Strain CCMP2098" /LENGTH=230 /DNA_ID=CAMNT_0012312073 /DNA_START=167 /DNA_END=856 /DNA_ORIENTATION=+
MKMSEEASAQGMHLGAAHGNSAELANLGIRGGEALLGEHGKQEKTVAAADESDDGGSGGGLNLVTTAETERALRPLSRRGKQAISFALYDQDGKYALLAAARTGSAGMVGILLGFNAIANLDLNLQDEDGKSALLWAAEKGSVEVVTVLVDANAKLDLVDKNGMSCFYGGMSALHYAAWNGFVEVVTVLVAAKANLDLVTTKCGSSALHFAAAGGFADVVKVLVAAKANL